ncbi:MAG: hypothetical protein AB4372_30870 [Xenococcus sp. (in: cyanobacteria)]
MNKTKNLLNWLSWLLTFLFTVLLILMAIAVLRDPSLEGFILSLGLLSLIVLSCPMTPFIQDIPFMYRAFALGLIAVFL